MSDKDKSEKDKSKSGQGQKGQLISFQDLKAGQAKANRASKESSHMEDIGQLIASLEVAIEQDPRNADLYLDLSDNLAQIGEQESAVHLLEYYLDEIDGNNANILLALANKYLLISYYNYSYISARRLMTRFPHSDLFEDAERLVEYLIIQSDEELDFPIIYDALYLEEDYELLKIEAEEQLRLEPDNLEAKNYQALAMRKLGWTMEAMEILDEIIELDPNNIMAHAELARIYRESNQADNFGRILQHLERLVPIQDKDTLDLAEILAEFGYHELVYKHLKRLIKQKKHQENDKIIFAYGVAAANNGDYAEALASFDRFTSLSPLLDAGRYYAYLMRRVLAGQESIDKLSYNNRLPYIDFMNGQSPEDEDQLTADFAYSQPLVYDSLIWMLHEGADYFKAEAIRLLSFLMTEDVEREFKKYLLDPQADDALKMYVMTELYDNGIYGPYEVIENNKKTSKTNYQVAFMTLQWREDWAQVMMNVKENFEPLHNRQSLLEKAHQQWVEFLAPQQKTFDTKLDIPAWSAALAYYAHSDYENETKREMIARTFGTELDAMMAAFRRLTET